MQLYISNENVLLHVYYVFLERSAHYQYVPSRLMELFLFDKKKSFDKDSLHGSLELFLKRLHLRNKLSFLRLFSQSTFPKGKFRTDPNPEKSGMFHPYPAGDTRVYHILG